MSFSQTSQAKRPCLSLAAQLRLLARLRIINILGINEARHSGEGRRRIRLLAMLALYLLLACMLMFCVGAICFSAAKLGVGSVVPLCLAVVCALVTLMFTLLRAGPMLFDLRDYEMLSALPLHPTAIIVSRYLNLYLSNAALTLAVLLPGAIACGIVLHPGAGYYLMLLMGAFTLPLIPMTIAMLVGMLIYMLSARFRRRSAAVLVLYLLATLAAMLLPVWMQRMQPDRLILSLRSLLDRVRGFYPPAGWFADGVTEANLPLYLGFSLGSILFFLLAATLVGRRYHAICTMLAARRSRHSFRLTAQRRTGSLAALYRREIKRYLASPIYVLNTAVGPILAVVLSCVLLFSGVGELLADFPLPIELAPRMLPFLLGLLLALSPSTSSAISMEGRQWWLIKSLPVATASVMHGKLLVNLTIALPAWLLSSVLSCLALRPAVGTFILLILLPLGYVLFTTLLGLRLNLAFPSFSWDNESIPVKQGKPVLFGMLSAMLACLLPAVAVALLPASHADLVSAITCMLLLAASALLWRSIAGFDLRHVD